MTPIQLLTKELNSHKKALRKSIQSYNKGDIDFATHNKHVSNLNHIIFEYEQAIKNKTMNTLEEIKKDSEAIEVKIKDLIDEFAYKHGQFKINIEVYYTEYKGDFDIKLSSNSVNVFVTL